MTLKKRTVLAACSYPSPLRPGDLSAVVEAAVMTGDREGERTERHHRSEVSTDSWGPVNSKMVETIRGFSINSSSAATSAAIRSRIERRSLHHLEPFMN